MREVRCLTQEKKHSHECELNTKPEQEQICNTIPCSPQVPGWCVWRLWQWIHVCLGLSARQPLSPPLCSQMKTAGTDVTTVWWWFRPGCVSTPTTRLPAVPRVPRVLSVPRGTDQPFTDSPGVQEGQKGWNDKSVEKLTAQSRDNPCDGRQINLAIFSWFFR